MKIKKYLKKPVYTFVTGCFLITATLLLTSLESNKIYSAYDVKLQVINRQDQEVANFMVNIADTPKKRARGLMFINSIPETYGMLFDFKTEENVTMWMKNTKMSLDILFIDENNQIVRIRRNNLPGSTRLIHSNQKVSKVLEINGGLSEELGIHEDMFIQY